MASNHTENYGLNQWEAGDAVLRTDFNADNAKIDAALTALADRSTEIAASALRMVTGQYWGTGKSSHTLELPFKAKFALIQEATQGTDTHLIYIGINFCVAQPGYTPNLIDARSDLEVKNTDTGIITNATGSVSEAELARMALNTQQHLYLYVAFG